MTMLYLAFLVMISTVQAGDCPISCTCSEIPRYELQSDDFFTSVICHSGNNITQNLPTYTYNLQIAEVQLNMNDFFEELKDTFQYLPYLTNLQFSSCNLLNVTSISFEEEHVRTLKIVRCQISSLPIVNITSLKVLDLSNNKIEVINLNPFRTLLSLEVLNLSANAIDVLYPNIFVGLSTLKCLDLSDNNITVLNDKVLIPVVNLQHLNLSNNRLEVLNEACFSSLLHLQQLDVSWNRLARVLPGSLELPSLARLLLAGNPGLGLSRKPTLLVGTGRRLQTVDASRTGLKQVPAALTHSIRTLRLAGNSIRAINCGDLDSYPLLQLLDFMSNNLVFIEDDALGRLDSLSILYLTDNKLRSIPHSLPEKLKVLHLENNEIHQIQLIDFQGLQQIEVLLLSSNKISNVEVSAFAQLGSLVTLDLSRNPIVMLPAGILSGPIRLQVLKLSSLAVVSHLKEVEFPLTAPEHLITLDLSNSPGLAHQLLADTAALAAARELQELNLSNTGLENIRSDLLHFLQQLRVLHLRENPINCTDLQWLGFWMRKQDEPEYRMVTCASPPELWGTPIIDLQDIDFKILQPTNATRLFESETHSTNVSNDAKANMSVQKENLFKARALNESEKTIRVNNDMQETPPELVSPKEKLQNGMLNVIPENSDRNLKAISVELKNINASNTTTESAYYAYSFQKNTNNTSRVDKYDNNKLNQGITDVGDLKENLTYYTNEATDINVTIPTAQMSLYGGDNNTGLAHPGMLILVIGILAAAAVLVMLTTRFRKKRNSRQLSDIEVSSIPGVTELW